jgi:O-acetyl-ADP-ribose deacetylase (regulator of RNase III)
MSHQVLNNYQEIEGDLIVLAKAGKFDVIAHGCNCFCKMKRGLAPQMAKAFDCDTFFLEGPDWQGDINKLGQIEFRWVFNSVGLWVVNAYTQYHWDTDTKPFDYDAFTLCARKMNHTFKGMHIGLPQIGSHLAGGDWEKIKIIIQNEFKDCVVTVVIFKQ